MKKTYFEFDTRKLTAGVLSAILYCVLSFAQYSLYMSGSVIFGSYVYLPGILVAIVALMFGPTVGSVCALAGQLIANVYVYGNAKVIDLLVIIIIGVAMGLMQDRLQVIRGGFGLVAYIECNIVHVIASIVSLVMMRPLYSFLVQDISLEEGIIAGVKVCAGNAAAMLTVGSLIMWIVSLIAANRCKKSADDGIER